jgi:hypothetical protein
MNTCDNCTIRKSAPFQAGANLEPLCSPLQAAVRFFRVLIPTCPTACLATHLRHAKPLAWADNWAYHVPAPADPIFWVYPVSACLFPGSTLTTCPLLLDGQPATNLLVRACQPLWPNPDDEVYRQFTSVAHTELALHLTPHGGWQRRFPPCHRGESSI